MGEDSIGFRQHACRLLGPDSLTDTDIRVQQTLSTDIESGIIESGHQRLGATQWSSTFSNSPCVCNYVHLV